MTQHAEPARRGPVRAARDAAETVEDAAGAVAQAVKPHLRGWIHAGAIPFVLALSIVSVCLAPAGADRWSVAVFGLSACLLFGTSAVYHRGTWSPRTAAVLRRADHSNIFLIIAGTYTPLAVMLLPHHTTVWLLWVVWGGAALGLLARIVWLGAPRWVYVPVYVALGWVAVGFLPQFWHDGGPAVTWLVVAGGLAYTLGAVVYGTKRPDPSPRWFGFHEVFHTLTVVGFTCHAVAIMIVAVRA
ncbi:PAQR family membrane homeostasis protein TrhA [Luteimicrobium subarcticum]|uniref:Hemolysin III n=1 Tax=Luteimicrobium subarcticum TaxID=620910 RepID=A0A2M8WTJ6_9MICO|nr:hemolysin III family protein [Luteimicrobium subarcticum]PJI94176.1 hemolysin III [Luteimicrobium subarcticum]